jgi:co-chaperonin GroES (HSP10)
MRKIKPRAKQVLVLPDEETPRENHVGIVTPDNVEQEQKAIGTVEAVGAGIEDLKAGDRVIYGAYAGEEITLTEEGSKDVKYKILFDEDVLALIEEV